MEGSAIFAISYFIFDLRNSRLVRFTPPPPPSSLCENRPIKSIRNGFRLTHVPPEFFSTYSRHVIRNFFLDRSTDIENVRPRLKERLDFSITVENRSETKSTRLESKEKSCDRDAFSLLIFIISKRDWKIVGIPRGKRASTRRLRGSEDPLANLIINATRRYLHVNRAKYPSFPRDGVATLRARLFTTTLIKPRFSASVP